MINNFLLRASVLLSFLVCLIYGNMNAQTTGSFDVAINFNGQPRQLSLYVPAGYNASAPAKLMVCLHGMGDNSNNYRNALINSITIQAAFPNAIFAFPDGGSDVARDFFTPAGDEAFIDTAISYVRTHYTVDTSYVLLQGFSLGGKSALRYGLAHPSAFKGLLLHTPAIYGVREAVAAEAAGGFQYSAATGMPIYVTHGASDVLYTGPIDSLVRGLMLHDAAITMNRVAGLAHGVPSLAQMPGLATFFDAPASGLRDIDLISVTTPIRACQSQYVIKCLFRNKGTEPVTSVRFRYTMNGITDSATWTGTLQSFQAAVLEIPVIATPGVSGILVMVSAVNNMADTILSNNQQESQFEFVATSTGIPFTEGFETANIPSGWINQTAGDYFSTWDVDNTVSASGTSSLFSFNSALVFDNQGRREVLYTPVLNLSGTVTPALNFDVAANYHHFTPPHVSSARDFADTLEVAVSVDCGASWQPLYRKAGADLATYSQPILNPVTIPASFQAPSAANWRTEHVSLQQFAGNTDVVLRFSYISGLGGWINMDNILVSDQAMPVSDPLTASLITLAPNPAHDRVTIKSEAAILSFRVADMQGNVIASEDGGSATTVLLETSTWVRGFYLLHLTTKRGETVAKLIIE